MLNSVGLSIFGQGLELVWVARGKKTQIERKGKKVGGGEVGREKER